MGSLDFLQTLRWQDVVDITLNSYILFRFYALFRGTNTFRVLVGIACLWFFQRVSLAMGLIVTSWALQGVTAAAALIIIVVFRNEIRAVFQTQNWQALLWGVPRRAAPSVVDMITSALFSLANRHIGAILVFPGKEDLSELVHGGIAWQGNVSEEMIESIFWPGNPVHDGAAVIEADKITSVGCILPLTDRGDWPTHWGTRHRAAAGLTERSDALVAIVSEEKGRVLAAKGTDMDEIPSPNEMKSKLGAHMNIKGTAGDGIKSEKLRSALVALTCLVLVTSAWISFSRGRDTLISIDVPIHYLNLKTGMEIVDTSTDTVRLQLSGFSTLINTVRPDQLAIRVDLSNAAPGNRTFPIEASQVPLPLGIALTGISPSSVVVLLDALAVRTLPLQVDWVGQLPDGLVLTDVRLEPSAITVTGRSQVLDELKTLYTEKMTLDAITGSGSKAVSPLLGGAVRLAEGQSKTVTVYYRIKKRDAPKAG